MKTYSQDLRERAVGLCDAATHSHVQVAALLNVSTAWLRRLLQRRRQTGTFAVLAHGGGPVPRLHAEHLLRLQELVQKKADVSLEELRQELGIAVSVSTIHRALARLRLTRKKKTFHAAEQDDDELTRQRAAWQQEQSQLDPQRLVFLDESGANASMTRLYGRAPSGQRVYDAVPERHWQMTTMVAALRADVVVAPLVFKGATDTAAFETYIEQVLVPTLRPGDLVIMDNLAAHKGVAIAQAIRAAKADVKYLPPYSPDFNPIEKMWSKIKAWLRKAATRTTERLYEAIAAAMRAVDASDCQGYFKSCGYAPHATPV